MNTISAEKLVSGYQQAQRVIARVGAYSLVLQKNRSLPTANPRNTPSSVWLRLPDDSRLEKASLALVIGGSVAAVGYGLAVSFGFVAGWEAFQAGITTLLK